MATVEGGEDLHHSAISLPEGSRAVEEREAYPWLRGMEVDALDSLASGEELSLQIEFHFSYAHLDQGHAIREEGEGVP